MKMIQLSVNVSQNVFFRMIGGNINTLQNWEQGRREPDGPARALLIVAEKNPDAVYTALHGAGSITRLGSTTICTGFISHSLFSPKWQARSA